MEYNKVAAKWWADKLRNPNLGSFDMGDDSRTGGLAMILGMMNAMNRQAPDENVSNFESELAELIKERVESCGSMYLDCDYGPGFELYNLASKHNVDSSLFPWKTHMHISSDEVKVSCGYGKPYVTIYPTE